MIWLIGNKGMLGTEVARQLSENKIEFIGTDIDIDITNIDILREFVKNKKIEWIINCAAYTAVDKAESDIELATKLNKNAPGNIAIVAREINATLIHISTDYVFDGTEDFLRTEDMKVNPIGIYGITKADGEEEIRRNTEKFYIIRTAWLYGWAGKNFVYTMIKAMNTHDSVKVVNDQWGTPTFAGDLANVIITLINKQNCQSNIPYGIYHCTDMGKTNWFEFTCEIKKQAYKYGLLQNDSCIVNSCTTQEYPTPARRPAYSVLSKDKIQNNLNIKLPLWEESLSIFLQNNLFDMERIK